MMVALAAGSKEAVHKIHEKPALAQSAPFAAALSMLLSCSAPPRSSVPRSSWSSLGHARRVRPLVPHALALRASAIPDRARARRRPDRRRVAHLARFVRSLRVQGLGTPAPVMPPKRLVFTGFYRYVRNPIYVAVTALIAGQGLLFGASRCWSTARSCGPDSSCSLSPTKSLRWASSSPTSTSATGRT